MEKTKWPVIIGVVLGTVHLCRTIPTTFAFDKPLLSAIIFLATVGSILTVLGSFLSTDQERTVQGVRYDAVPLNEVGEPHPSRQPSPNLEQNPRASSPPRRSRTVFITLTSALCVRVLIFLRILGNIQCSTSTLEPLVPFAFACWDYLRGQRHTRRKSFSDPTESAYEALQQNVMRAQYRFLAAVSLVSFGGIVTLAIARSPPSTHVCAASYSIHWLMPFLQMIGTGVDVVIVYCIARLLREQEHGKGMRSRFVFVGWAFLYAALISAIILCIMTMVYYSAFAKTAERRRFFEIPPAYFSSVLKLDVALCFTFMCAILSMFHIGITTATLLPTFVSICTVTLSYAWNNILAFPPTQSGFGLFTFCLTTIGFVAYLQFDTICEDKAGHPRQSLFKRVPSWLYFILSIMLLIQTGLWIARSSTVNYHPIDLLMYEAQVIHEDYLNQTSSSKTLAEAVSTYRERYNRHPPPGFQHWYKYATARNSVIIDDFDRINEDLLPFWDVKPHEIRDRTWSMIANPSHDAAGLSIRNGRVLISPHSNPMNRWMLEGLVEMIRPFAEWLPDMDLAFNVNDEPRVAVPFAEIERMREAGRYPDLVVDEIVLETSFSAERAKQWRPIPREPHLDNLMTEMSRQRSFYQFGVTGCPPGSPVFDQRLWDVQRLCTSCIRPHSIGAFLANWTLAGNICHQPDLANLHGFYISPASFKGVHKLYPIFSQSKAYGFNDILYPSAWNYIRKAQYAPNNEYSDVPYANKNHSIFWRGGTTEGISHDFGHWKGMTRQRFLRLTNNVDGPSSPQSILMPSSYSGTWPKHKYTPASISDLTNLMQTDIRVVKEVNHCNGPDCAQQEQEFAPIVKPSDFQAHWQYKYLLDMDGAGFSGRFLPLLHSHSLPFKAALFREWYADRVTAWQHFVPLDLRGHGFWATLAYFAGFEGELNGRVVKLEPHEKEGQRIAENGRAWANAALRKEDMEIYFFRLLLEWGRLTDDRRDKIGFGVNAV